MPDGATRRVSVYCYTSCPGPYGCECFDAQGRALVQPDLPPLADHGSPLGLLRSLWVVLRGARFYGR